MGCSNPRPSWLSRSGRRLRDLVGLPHGGASVVVQRQRHERLCTTRRADMRLDSRYDVVNATVGKGSDDSADPPRRLSHAEKIVSS